VVAVSAQVLKYAQSLESLLIQQVLLRLQKQVYQATVDYFVKLVLWW
jgi:hypothetical protein